MTVRSNCLLGGWHNAELRMLKLFRVRTLLLGRLSVGIVIPVLVRREYVAREALGLYPLVSAARTKPSCPKGVPDGVATWIALPPILC